MGKTVLITGSGGLIGSESVKFFSEKGFIVHGIDNNLRKYFFGDEGDVSWNISSLLKSVNDYHHHNIDLRDIDSLKKIFQDSKFDLIIHCAAQPSHDWAAREPLTDFSVNALATLNLLECFRNYSPNAVFIFTSTNKVYGDTPNKLPLIELQKRFEIIDSHEYSKKGVDEKMSIDNSKHSVFGASKLAADIMVQEYGKYFNLNTVCFRGGCLTGPAHSAAELHGFLAYLVKCIATGKKYKVFGYKGKQVRDNIHSYDLVNAFYHFYLNPKKGEVYNIGGSRYSNISILEAIEKIEQILGKKADLEFLDSPREGDHIWYISDVSKFKKDYPNWEYKYNIDNILLDLCKLFKK